MDWLKKLFAGQPDHTALAPPSVDPAATLDELVQANLVMGQQIDEIREKRRAVKARIDELIALRDAPPQGEA
jgi:hypothetical protein